MEKQKSPLIFKIVLTGGPCGGKTTGQARLSIFFENIGWKVYRVPETATLLLGGGISFRFMNQKQKIKFQENLLKTMIQLERAFFDIVEKNPPDIKFENGNFYSAEKEFDKILIICDRGAMDPAAYMTDEEFSYVLKKNNWSVSSLRDNRYDQVIHMMTAANGAEDFYSCQGNQARHEGIQQAVDVDKKTSDVWIGHPYFDIIDNSTNFDAKILRLISVVCRRLGIETGESLKISSLKKKFLVQFNENVNDQLKSLPPNQVFTVTHDYLISPPEDINNSISSSKKMPQARLRKRGFLPDGNINNVDKLNDQNYTYTYTIRKPEVKGQAIEIKRQIDVKDYNLLLQSQRDKNHFTIYKTRRCFLYDNHYYRLDVYQNRCPGSCKGLVLLETYSSKPTSQLKLPPFLNIVKEVTGKPEYSMWNLSLKDNKKFDSQVLMDHSGENEHLP